MLSRTCVRGRYVHKALRWELGTTMARKETDMCYEGSVCGRPISVPSSSILYSISPPQLASAGDAGGLHVSPTLRKSRSDHKGMIKPAVFYFK